MPSPGATFQIVGCNNPDCFVLGVRVDYATSGVPSIARGRGIKSISDDGTGLFTITTYFNWIDIIGGGNLNRAAAASGITAEVVPAGTIPAQRKIQIRLTNASGSAADPTTGDGIYLLFLLQCSGLPR